MKNVFSDDTAKSRDLSFGRSGKSAFGNFSVVTLQVATLKVAEHVFFRNRLKILRQTFGCVIFFLCCSIVTLLFAGCIKVDLPEQKTQATRTFDLLPLSPQENGFGYNVEILPFNSDSPAKFKMLHRSGTVLTADEFNKWVQTPSLMLTRLFRSAFTTDTPGEKEFKLYGMILNFEADDNSGSAELTVKYTLSTPDSSVPLFVKKLTVSEKMKAGTPEAFAEAMSLAVFKQIAEVKALILKASKTK